jgi:2-C-methyl-D-erythritol 4-phosphate cytidylyltransferase
MMKCITQKIIVLLHDGCRPIVSADVISDNIECVKKYGSSVTVCPVSETIVEVDDTGSIYNIPIRKRCYLSKAPQGFYLSELMKAHNKAIEENRFDCTNSAELMHRYGHSLHVVYDTDENIKITTPTDMIILEGLMKYRKSGEANEG